MSLFLVFLVWWQTVRANDLAPTMLEGNWVRVVDGCGDLPPAEVARLNTSGGGNQVSRAERLMFRGDTFLAQMFTPSRCAGDIEAVGPKIRLAEPECRGGISQGSLEMDGPDRFTIRAKRIEGANPWGDSYTVFDFKLFDNDVLYVRFTQYDPSCGTDAKRVYFIRAPLS